MWSDINILRTAISRLRSDEYLNFYDHKKQKEILKSTGYIYEITDTKINKCYIGSTENANIKKMNIEQNIKIR